MAKSRHTYKERPRRNQTTNLLKPEEYEYLWSNYDVNYIFVSCYLFSMFRDSDIVLTYDWEQKELRYFLSKEDHKRISKEALSTYEDRFVLWKKTIKSDIQHAENLIKGTEKHRTRVSHMTLDEIKKHFLERTRAFQSLGNDYFHTEFFAVDRTEKLIVDNPKRYATLKVRLQEMGRIKLKAREVLTQFYNYRIVFKPYAQEIAERYNRDNIEWLSFTEIADLIKGKYVPYSNRGKKYWVLAKRLNWEPVYGNVAQQILNKFDAYLFAKSETIRGIVANRGKYKGSAKVLRTVFSDAVAAEIAKVRKGDVLVANTTGPEVMTACARAAAIVTDEGGLTSHAAIVSRELKIPCIVGTKIATKVLKDGDLVEVDGEKGTVKVLKRANR